jgi:hypothetical protein
MSTVVSVVHVALPLSSVPPTVVAVSTQGRKKETQLFCALRRRGADFAAASRHAHLLWTAGQLLLLSPQLWVTHGQPTGVRTSSGRGRRGPAFPILSLAQAMQPAPAMVRRARTRGGS